MFTTLALITSFGGQPACNTGCPTPRPQYPVPYGPDINAIQPCPPLGPPAGVLPVKFVVPRSVTTTALPGTPLAKSFSTAATFGLRPGYVYRFALSGIGRDNETLFPEIEVRGTLHLRPGMPLMDYFAAVNYSERDLERAAAGALITKVIYLEDPEKAVPIKTTADMPHEIPEDTEDLAIKEALANGRLVAIVRLGNRKPTDAALAAMSIAGTILLPGEQYLGQPTSPPTLGWQGVPLFDPILGPKFPKEECFVDGGDTGPRLGVRDDGRLGGLSPTDTAAEFRVNDKNRVTASNTVCICAPRFVVRRSEVGINGYATSTKPNAGTVRMPPAVANQKTPPLAVVVREKPQGVSESIHTQIQRGQIKPQGVDARTGCKAVFTLDKPVVVTGIIKPEEIQNADDFLLVKDVEPKTNVKVGDEVTVTLTYTNRTGKPVTDLVVSDSLSGRLEYIPGSSQSDRPSNVTTAPNDAGSVVVRFELPGTLLPNQGGMVKFKAKVR